MTNQENEDDDVSMWDNELRCLECGWTGTRKNTRINGTSNSISMACPRCYAKDNFEVISEE